MPRVAPDSNDIVVWKFDEAGAPFVNSSTQGSPGASANMTTLSSTTFGGETNPKLQQQGPFGAGSFAVEFLGSQSDPPRCFISGANNFFPTLPMTFSGWIMFRRYDHPQTAHFIQKQKTIGVWSGASFGVQMIQDQGFLGNLNGELSFETNANNSAGNNFIRTDRTQPYPLGVWTHLGWAADTTSIAAYINGDLVGTSTFSGVTGSGFNYDTSVNAGPWFIGAIPAGSGAPEEPYCQIADWRIANVKRPQSYFQNIYFQGQLDWTGNATQPALGSRTRYFKLRASCTASPSGFVTWVNTSGDNTGQPSCSGTLGPTIIVDTWVQ